MGDGTKGLIGTIICFGIVGATIVSCVYIAYNPKACSVAEQREAYPS